MKTFIYFLLINISLGLGLSSSLYAEETEPCQLDIYFGNGVWNTDHDALLSKEKLEKFINNHPPKNQATDEPNNYAYHLAYNATAMKNKDDTSGLLDDLIETHWQLYESGQISEGYFSFVSKILDGELNHENFLIDLREIISASDGNLTSIYTQMQENSFKLGHSVLLVSHSQGNLFANKIYHVLEDEEKKLFRNVAIATPAFEVSSGGGYVTVRGDPVITNIIGSLWANAYGKGHSFVPAYLESQYEETKDKIASYINGAIASLNQNNQCKKKNYDYLTFVGYECSESYNSQKAIVDIYGVKNIDNNQSYTRLASDVKAIDPVYYPAPKLRAIPVCYYDEFEEDNTQIETPHFIPYFDKLNCNAYIFENTSTASNSLAYILSQTYYNLSQCTRYRLSGDIYNMLIQQE